MNQNVSTSGQQLQATDELNPMPYFRRAILNRITTGGTALLLGLTAISSAVGASEAVQRFSFDLTGTQLDSDCLDETLQATQGTFLVVVHEHSDGAGGFHFVLQQTIQNAELVGLDSGTVYRAVGEGMLSTHVHPPYPVIITSVLRERWVTEGAEPDVVIDASFKLRINGNGDVVLLSVEPEECSTTG